MKYLGRSDSTNYKDFGYPTLEMFLAAKKDADTYNAAVLKSSKPTDIHQYTTCMFVTDDKWRINKQWADITPK
jgi:hypothetical protein